ncbi:MAG TPA: hypothetical protein PLJ17_10445 [Syntrophorhabdaceae bacterium]|nr:hypothetical protein [Syntrophorhabdaceae bacterium]
MSLFSKDKDKKSIMAKMKKLKRCKTRLMREFMKIEENFSLPKQEKNKRR